MRRVGARDRGRRRIGIGVREKPRSVSEQRREIGVEVGVRNRNQKRGHPGARVGNSRLNLKKKSKLRLAIAHFNKDCRIIFGILELFFKKFSIIIENERGDQSIPCFSSICPPAECWKVEK